METSCKWRHPLLTFTSRYTKGFVRRSECLLHQVKHTVLWLYHDQARVFSKIFKIMFCSLLSLCFQVGSGLLPSLQFRWCQILHYMVESLLDQPERDICRHYSHYILLCNVANSTKRSYHSLAEVVGVHKLSTEVKVKYVLVAALSADHSTDLIWQRFYARWGQH